MEADDVFPIDELLDCEFDEHEHGPYQLPAINPTLNPSLLGVIIEKKSPIGDNNVMYFMCTCRTRHEIALPTDFVFDIHFAGGSLDNATIYTCGCGAIFVISGSWIDYTKIRPIVRGGNKRQCFCAVM